jgi:hypothetical protein
MEGQKRVVITEDTVINSESPEIERLAMSA